MRRFYKTSETNQPEPERPPTISQHFRAIDSVLEVYAEAVESIRGVLWELEDHVSDILYNRLDEHITQLDDCLWAMDKGLTSLRKNFYIDSRRKLFTDRIDYVLPSVDEELK